MVSTWDKHNTFVLLIDNYQAIMISLSVNINKIATLRNARGGNTPDVLKAAADCQRFGADGITVHPRPDERHIRYRDVEQLRQVVTREFNVEGYPDDRFLELVLKVRPEQVTLVPDPPGVLTSNAGWDTVKNAEFLRSVIQRLKKAGIRVSVFIDTNQELISAAVETGTDRIELYTEAYAAAYLKNAGQAVAAFREAALLANKLGLGVNAGHDLNLDNLSYFATEVPHLMEVSIGHALISDALYLGLENTIRLYKRKLDH
jgi:pyridoxine 5-phosphate synthase